MIRAPEDKVRRVDLYLALAAMLAGAVLGMVAMASQAAAQERRRREPTASLVEALSSQCKELEGTVEAMRDERDQDRERITNMVERNRELNRERDELAAKLRDCGERKPYPPVS